MKTMQCLTGLLALGAATSALAQITFYQDDGFRGPTFFTAAPVEDLRRHGFNDRASSVIVESGLWQVCENARYGGRCVVLQRGNYDSLSRMGLNDRLSSTRPIDDWQASDQVVPPPPATPAYEYRRRPDERTYEAPVTSSRAVVGPPNERCWTERERVNEPNRGSNTGGAIAGALLGGILGHQVGGGAQGIATAGGAVAGAVIGSNVGTHSTGAPVQDVRRCENVANTTPAYWDVTYRYRGVDHRVQMNTAPGSSITVNRFGEPRQ